MSDSEEEILIFAEFDENVNIGNYRSIHALGVESKKPIIQMDDTFFIGKYENPLGTYMFFQADPEPHSSDMVFDKIPDQPLKFQCKTRKSIVMEHSYVTPKGVKFAWKVNIITCCAYENIDLPGNWRYEILYATQAAVNNPHIIHLSPSASPRMTIYGSSEAFLPLATLVTQCTIICCTVKPELQPNDQDIELVNFNSIQEAIEKFRSVLNPEVTVTSTRETGKENEGSTDTMKVDENSW